MLLEASLIVMIAGFAMAIWSRDLLKSVILLGIGDLALALSFYIMAAPDIAVTQVSVATALSVLILVYTIKKTRRMEE